MSLIYEPKGKAREYSPLALNVYSGGCEHQCDYCYCQGIGAWSDYPRPRNLRGLEKDATTAGRQVLLSFMSDPYAPIERRYRNTRAALQVLAYHACSVAILTKGGSICLDDLDLFQDWPVDRVKVGATLTFLDPDKSRKHEPGAALPEDRIAALASLSSAGIKTWASIEPVIDPQESLAIIEASLPFVDAYKVGKLNHRKNTTDWLRFGQSAVALIRAAKKTLYVKDDLRAAMPGFEFSAKECDPETVFLPDRPSGNLFD